MTTTFVYTALLAGLLGGAAMELVLWLIGAAGWAKADMLIALGSLLTRRRERAWRVGAIVHLASAMCFGVLYTVALVELGYTKGSSALMTAGAIGFAHGLIVSLGLVWVVAEQHPLEEFNDAGLAIGLAHIVGHVVYGGVVGLVVSLSPL
jgi:hypothetical protein